MYWGYFIYKESVPSLSEHGFLKNSFKRHFSIIHKEHMLCHSHPPNTKP